MLCRLPSIKFLCLNTFTQVFKFECEYLNLRWKGVVEYNPEYVNNNTYCEHRWMLAAFGGYTMYSLRVSSQSTHNQYQLNPAAITVHTICNGELIRYLFSVLPLDKWDSLVVFLEWLLAQHAVSESHWWTFNMS